ncbi:MAG: hypothetical protein ACHP79_10410 [Terriglobales bacterium]
MAIFMGLFYRKPAALPCIEKPAYAAGLKTLLSSKQDRNAAWILLLVLVLFASFHACFYMCDGRVYRFDGGNAMPALIVFGLLQMVLGLLQGFQRSLHVRLVFIIVTGNSGDGNAQKTQNDGQRKQPGNFSHGNYHPFKFYSD